MLKSPKNEKIWAQYCVDGTVLYVITSTAVRDIYYLCEVVDGKCIKTKKKSSNPLELEKHIKWE